MSEDDQPMADADQDDEREYNENEQRAICEALTILIWKIPAGTYKTAKDLAEYMAAELNQATSYKIDIRWNDVTEVFEVPQELRRNRNTKWIE